MKVILQKDVKGLGRKFDIKEVNDGYARNFLLPSGSVQIATPKLVEELEERKKMHLQELNVRDELLEKSLNELNGQTVEISGKTNDQGHMFSSIHAKDIKEAIEKKFRMSLDEKYFELKSPIKEIGEHEVSIRVGEKKAKIKLLLQRA